MDGTIEVIAGALRVREAGRVTAEIIQKIRHLAEAAKSGAIDPNKALEEAVEFLPSETAAAIKKFGANNPIAALCLVLYIISQLSTAASNFSSTFKTLSPSDPPPPPVINNNISITNQVASCNGGDEPVTEPLKKEQLRRLKQMRAQEEKKANRGKRCAKSHAKDICALPKNPAHD